MGKLNKGRPDGIDRAILNYIQNAPHGATIPEINHAVCPGRRENFVRYRVTTLHSVGLLRETRIFNRVVVFPVGDDRQTREAIADV